MASKPTQRYLFKYWEAGKETSIVVLAAATVADDEGTYAVLDGDGYILIEVPFESFISIRMLPDEQLEESDKVIQLSR